jgi:hypothetical protein
VVNAAVTGNRISPVLVTTSTSGTTAVTAGNILLQTAGDLVVSTTSGTSFTPYGTLNIKALSLDQVQSLNGGAGVLTSPAPAAPTIPPPPVYNGALIVPLPTP